MISFTTIISKYGKSEFQKWLFNNIDNSNLDLFLTPSQKLNVRPGYFDLPDDSDQELKFQGEDYSGVNTLWPNESIKIIKTRILLNINSDDKSSINYLPIRVLERISSSGVRFNGQDNLIPPFGVNVWYLNDNYVAPLSDLYINQTSFDEFQNQLEESFLKFRNVLNTLYSNRLERINNSIHAGRFGSKFFELGMAKFCLDYDLDPNKIIFGRFIEEISQCSVDAFELEELYTKGSIEAVDGGIYYVNRSANYERFFDFEEIKKRICKPGLNSKQNTIRKEFNNIYKSTDIPF